MFRPEITPEVMNRRGIGRLPVRSDLIAPNGFLHAADIA